MLKILKKIDEIVAKALHTLVKFCIIMLLVLLFSQVIARYFRIQALAPQDEIINLFFAWFVFIGIALLFREDDHLRVEFVDGFMNKHPRIHNYYKFFVHLCQAIFISVFFSSSLNLYLNSVQRTSPMLHLPQRFWYGSVLCSAFLMGIYFLVKLITDISSIIQVRRKKEVAT